MSADEKACEDQGLVCLENASSGLQKADWIGLADSRWISDTAHTGSITDVGLPCLSKASATTSIVSAEASIPRNRQYRG